MMETTSIAESYHPDGTILTSSSKSLSFYLVDVVGGRQEEEEEGRRHHRWERVLNFWRGG
jgi:hypothetical protein